MAEYREILRQAYQKNSQRSIAASVHCSRHTVSDVLYYPLQQRRTRAAAPKSTLGKALTYLKEQWPYLLNYLKDGAGWS